MTAAEATAIALGCGAVWEDLRRRHISNWLTGGGAAAGLLLGLATGGWRGLAAALAGAAVGFVVFLLFYLVGGMGGGDVKLMAAFGALMGPGGAVVAAVLGAIAGALVAAVWTFIRPRAAAIPYAPAIVLGAWLTLLGGGN